MDRPNRSQKHVSDSRSRNAKLSRPPGWGVATGTEALGDGSHKSIFSGYHDSDRLRDDYRPFSTETRGAYLVIFNPAVIRPAPDKHANGKGRPADRAAPFQAVSSFSALGLVPFNVLVLAGNGRLEKRTSTNCYSSSATLRVLGLRTELRRAELSAG